ncbi:Cytochrome c oxidase, subunit II (Cytochrome aa3 subunit 2) [Candidatus Glomeribacter gigasporarum BEG34]|uniref:Cytochrome c oxidase subunit 2 n=1 Tax=Candidatus Glomeribacter gigasporarum BEG34 TaxID=1070319 RepID=G2J7L5_9BURK|nr:Cytochrome c oxidase, subunit II (Cytochrome aa3 subunit 2) [Candidatus Glomeribacter gigasporarum BEG34]
MKIIAQTRNILKNGLALAGGAWANAVWALEDKEGLPPVNGMNFQTPVTEIAQTLYSLHTLMLAICGVIFVGVFGVMFYSIFAHRKSKGRAPAHFHENMAVEILWTAAPLLIIVLMALPATQTVMRMKDTTNPDLTVKVTGYQWKWGYEYLQGPGTGVQFLSTLTTPRDEVNGRSPISETYLQEVDHPLVVPAHKKIRILTTSSDVVHSWYVPAFGVKQDAIPGVMRDTWFKADKVGTYRGFCTELCGKDHAYMPVVVKVLSGADYAQWVERAQKGQIAVHLAVKEVLTMDELKARGRQVYAMHCAVCHQDNGKGIGPFPAIDGGAVASGPLDAHLKLVLQGKGQMPPWAHTLNDLEIAAVTTYQRNAWNNQTGEIVQPAQVSALR